MKATIEEIAYAAIREKALAVRDANRGVPGGKMKVYPPEVRTAALELVEKGWSLRRAAAFFGLPAMTVRNWRVLETARASHEEEQ